MLRHGRRAHVAFEEFFTLHHIAVRYVRRLGEHYYLVPATVRPAGYTTPVLCRRRTPPGVSRRVERRRERRALHSFGLYLVSYSRDGGHNTPSGLGGRKGRLLGNAITNLVEDASHLWLAGVVPDGVASVRLTFKGRSHTRGVTRNFWVVRLGGSPPPDELEHSTTEWLAADGSVRRAFHGIANPWP